MSGTSKRTEIDAVTSHVLAGNGGRKKPSKKDRELDEPNNADTYTDDKKPKAPKNDNPKDRELDEPADAGDAATTKKKTVKK